MKILVVSDWLRHELSELVEIPPELNIVHARSEDITPAMLRGVEVLCTLAWFPDPRSVPDLRLIHLISSGSDQLTRSIFNPDVVVTTSRGANAVGVAEYVFAALLSWQRQTDKLAQWQLTRVWPPEQRRMRQFVARRDLVGTTMAIIGYGSVGRRVARVGSAFGLNVVAVNSDGQRKPSTDSFAQEGDPDCSIPDVVSRLDDMIGVAEADYVCVSLPLNEMTRGVLDDGFFHQLRNNPFFIDVSRGGVCEADALMLALNEGRVVGAAVDVFATEPLPSGETIWSTPNLAMSPHIAAHSDLYERRVAELIVHNSVAVLNQRTPLNVVGRIG